MITMQIKAPVGYGVRHMVSKLFQTRTGYQPIWVTGAQEQCEAIFHQLAVPSQTVRSFLRERSLGMKLAFNLVIVSDVTPAQMKSITHWCEANPSVEVWLVSNSSSKTV